MINRYIIALSVFILLSAPGAHAQWEQVGEPGTAYAITLHGTSLFAGMQGDSIYVSPDQGGSWTSANTGIAKASVSP